MWGVRGNPAVAKPPEGAKPYRELRWQKPPRILWKALECPGKIAYTQGITQAFVSKGRF
jgi:hypothetical protein